MCGGGPGPETNNDRVLLTAVVMQVISGTGCVTAIAAERNHAESIEHAAMHARVHHRSAGGRAGAKRSAYACGGAGSAHPVPLLKRICKGLDRELLGRTTTSGSCTLNCVVKA